MHNDKTWKQQLLKMSHLRIMQISKTIKTTTIRKRERGSGGERGEGRHMDGGMLQRGKQLEFNFRVNLIWVGWVNFNSGGFFFFFFELGFCFGLGCF